MRRVPRGGTWNADGVIVFAPTSLRPLMRVAASGGIVAPVTQLAVGTRQPSLATVFAGWPSIPLLDGGWAAADAWRLCGLARRWRADARHASRDGACMPRPAISCWCRRVCWPRYPFDAARATVAGEPIPVAQAVGTDDGAFHSAFSVSATGRPGPSCRRCGSSGSSSGSTAWARCWAHRLAGRECAGES